MGRKSVLLVLATLVAPLAWAAGLPPLDRAGSQPRPKAQVTEPSGGAPAAEGGLRANKKADMPPMVISTGERISVEGKGLSIVPPMGWEIYRNYAGATLLFQVPFSEQLKYQRTIQVMSFKGQKYIDKFTEDEFAKVIISNFSKSSMSVSDYRLRNKLPVEMADGTDGLLYYTEFKIDEVPLMQLHILISSATNHYLMTFTDLAEHFEQEDSVYLKTAYDSMISAEVDDPVSSRFQFPIKLGIGLVVLLVVGLLLRTFGKVFAARSYGRVDNSPRRSRNEGDLEAVEVGADYVEEGNWNLNQSNASDDDDGFSDDFTEERPEGKVG